MKKQDYLTMEYKPLNKEDIFALYDAVYEELFAGKFEQPELFLVTIPNLDDDDLYSGAFLNDEYEIEIVPRMHEIQKNPIYELVDTIVHEYVHVLQISVHGRVNPATYHDKWFDKRMEKYMLKLLDVWG
jgi:hypothetical protein